MAIPIRSTWQKQRGAAALAVTLLLLFGMTLVVFFVNRALTFEQKTSANQRRATVAFEAGEAGLEWAMAMLNDPTVLAAAPSCAAATTYSAANRSFRERYIVPTAPVGTTAAGFYPLDDLTNPANPTALGNSRAGCNVAANGALACGCPTPGTDPSLGTATNARFMVEFNRVAGDPLSIEIVSRGCSNADAAQCLDASGVGDAVSISRAVVKLVPAVGRAPGSALTTGSAAVSGGNLSVVNMDVATNGITINSGTTVTQGSGTRVATLPGTPPSASILDNDPSLNALTTADADGNLFFQSFFGMPMADYKKDPQTKVITSADCGNAGACGTLVSNWYNKGFQQFWIDPDVSFTNGNLPSVGTLGTKDKPIFLAGAGNVELKSNLVAYGFFYAATATATENWDYDGSGSGTVFGAFVSRGSFDKGSGTLNLVYDPSIFGQGGMPAGRLVRVPGSWRDSDRAYQ